jgi:membrane fusion protein, macrolide-specific efflux system
MFLKTTTFIPVTAALLSGLFLSSCSSGQKIQPKMGKLVEAVYGIGTVTARNTYQLKIGITTSIRKFYVKEGQAVRQGDPLVSFDDGQVFRAPFAGVVTSLPYQQGETVFPQMPVLTLTQMNDPYVVVSLEQSAALKVKAGQGSLLSFETLRGQRLEGKVTSIYPKDGQFFVNIEAEKMPAEVLVGMTADVAVQVSSKDNVLQIPLVAVENGKVRIRRKGLTQKVAVKLGATDGTWAEVTDDSVKPDDTIIVPGKK